MARLVVESVASASRLRRALSAGDAREYGALEGDELTVEDEADAQMLVDTYPNVRWADADADSDDGPDEDPMRANVDGEETSVPCTVEDCGRSFDTVRGMKAHRRQAHDVTDSDGDTEA